MKIALACDHGALNLKKAIIDYLSEHNIEYVDFGTFNNESCDYPDFALPAAESVAQGDCKYGVVLCSTGIGVSIVANKVRGIRCAHCSDLYSAEFTRRHNDANMIAMGEKIVNTELAVQLLDKFLNTEFEGGRHQRRVDKISAIEKIYMK